MLSKVKENTTTYSGILFIVVSALILLFAPGCSKDGECPCKCFANRQEFPVEVLPEVSVVKEVPAVVIPEPIVPKLGE